MGVEAIKQTNFTFRMTGEVIVRVRRWDEGLEEMVDTDEECSVYFDGLAKMKGLALENRAGGVPRAIGIQAMDDGWTVLG